MKVVSLVGARPQFIKEAVLHKSLKKAGIEEIVVNSGQHYDANMADVFFETLGIGDADYNLEVGSGKHGEMTGKIIIELEKVLEKEAPDLLLVYGDTNTTLAGAVVASKMKIPIGHVEAGVRMEPKDMPEEINRTLTDHVSKYLFCTSERSVRNLKNEGIEKNVHFVGDVMYDLFLLMKEKFNNEKVEELGIEDGEYYVVTIHRDYNTDHKETLEEILRQLQKLSEESPVIFPMHPRTKKKIEEFNLNSLLKGITVTEPLEYLDLMGLVSSCKKVVTDSGGVQKESYFAGKEAVIVMPDPAWPELVEMGVNHLAEPSQIYEKAIEKGKGVFVSGVYGSGDAGEKITKIIIENEK